MSLMNNLLTYINKKQIASFRIGVSGPPGAGKSSLIEPVGLSLLKRGFKVGVLAVDPSSTITGGSILADKLRMPNLSIDPNAFVRPSPSRGTLGGVARGTQAAIKVLEAAGFSRILVETVGVGQSEVAVDGMVDMFLLLIPPTAGDEYQGIKKGVMEMADLIAITKCDGDLVHSAQITQTEYRSAVSLFHPKYEFWKTPVVTCSSVTNSGIDEIDDIFEKFRIKVEENGTLVNRRKEQNVRWFWHQLEEQLIEKIKTDKRVAEIIPSLIEQTEEGSILPSTAVETILRTFNSPHEENIPTI